MRKFVLLLSVLFLVSGSSFSQYSSNDTGKVMKSPASILDFTMKTIDGTPRALSYYKGKVLLVVNTASLCGYTPQYETLEKLYEKYKDKGFMILAFPANNFGKQEPGTNSEIKEFCSSKFHVSFDLFEKISVKGSDQDPLYQYITKNSPYPGEIKWNFQKYLVDKSGNLRGKYLSPVDPMSDELTAEVEKLLAEKGT